MSFILGALLAVATTSPTGCEEQPASSSPALVGAIAYNASAVVNVSMEGRWDVTIDNGVTVARSSPGTIQFVEVTYLDNGQLLTDSYTMPSTGRVGSGPNAIILEAPSGGEAGGSDAASAFLDCTDTAYAPGGWVSARYIGPCWSAFAVQGGCVVKQCNKTDSCQLKVKLSGGAGEDQFELNCDESSGSEVKICSGVLTVTCSTAP